MAILLIGIKKLSYPLANKASTRVVPAANSKAKYKASLSSTPDKRCMHKMEHKKDEIKKAPEPIRVFVPPKTVNFPFGNRFPTKAAIGSDIDRISKGK